MKQQFVTDSLRVFTINANKLQGPRSFTDKIQHSWGQTLPLLIKNGSTVNISPIFQ